MASVRKLANGKYQAQFRPVPGGKQITKTGDRRGDVQRWLDEQTASRVTGSFVDPRAGKITLASFYATWADRQVWESSTRMAMNTALKSAPFVEKPIQRVTRADVELWVKAMSKTLAPQTAKTRVMNVRTVLRGAIVDKIIQSDPSAGVRLPTVRRTEASMVIPTTAEVRAILDRASTKYQLLFASAAFAGLRLGEASALQLGDIDFLNRRISVRRQVTKGLGGPEVRLPKYGSERVVPAASPLLDSLAAHAAYLGIEGQPGAWLFPNGSGGPAAPSTVNSAWLAARGKLHFNIHALRHFYASGLIAAGCDVVTVQKALGHSKPSITLDTYSHLWPKAEDRTRAAATSLMGEVYGAADELLTSDTAASQ